MKKMLFGLVLMGCSAAFAMPAVGDRAVYTYKQTSAEGTMSVTIEQKIVSFKDGVYQIDTTVTAPNGQSQTQSESVAADNMVTDAQVDYVMANCAALKGEIVQQSFAVGSLKACKMSETNDQGTTTTMLYAKVPFALAAMYAKSADSSAEAVIKEMTWGQGR